MMANSIWSTGRDSFSGPITRMAYSGRQADDESRRRVPVGAVYRLYEYAAQDAQATITRLIWRSMFDAARKNFRNDIYADYKANRDETPEDLIPQFPLVRDAVAGFRHSGYWRMEGYEADDLIAAYTRLGAGTGEEGRDRFVGQRSDAACTSEGVRMLDPDEKQVAGVIGPNRCIEKFGVDAGEGRRRAGAGGRQSQTTCRAFPGSG
jgi:hypothetical protein